MEQIYSSLMEFFVFLVSYTYFSLALASKEVTADYIKKVIETQISFSSSLSLSKDENFQRKVKKIYNYFKL